MDAQTPLSRRRPAAWSALLFGAGMLPAHFARIPLTPLLIGALLLFSTAAASARLRPYCLCLLLLLLGALRYETYTALSPVNHIERIAPFDRQGIIRGHIAEEPERGPERIRFPLELESLQTDSLHLRVAGRVLVTVKEIPLTADCGDTLLLRGRLRRPQPARNPGAFDYRAFLALQQIHATFSLRRRDQILAITPGPGPWYYEYLVVPIRASIRASIERNLSGPPAGLLEGMLLGEKYRIPEEVKDRFRATGLAHALVISGLHVGLVAAFFLTGLRLCRLPDRIACAGTILLLALYALVTQMQPPVVRAGLMGSVILGGRLLGRDGEIYNSLGLAALLILALWPASIASLSFQLSFGATLSILGLHRPLLALFPEGWRREDRWVGRWIVAPLCVSLAAQLGTGPLIAHHFGQFAPIAPVANLLVVPLLALAVGLGILASLTGCLHPFLAIPFNACNGLVLQILIGTVDRFAALPFASLAVPQPGIPLLLWAGALAVLAARLQRPRARKIGLFLLLIGLDLLVWSRLIEPHDFEITFVDVGQGDSILLRFPDGKTMLVDGGDRSRYFDYGERVLLPFLHHRGIDRIDIVVASHAHGDHIGGLVALLERLEVGHYLDSGQAVDTWAARRLRQLIAEKRISYHRVAAGDSLTGLGGVGCLVLHPTAEFVTLEGESPHGLNNGSVVLHLTFGKISLLLTGDAEEETDPALLAWGDRLRARILKVAHHGSPTSSQSRFIRAVQPEIAVIQVGEGNKFDHPSPTVVARYLEGGTEVLRTDRRGAILLRTDGEKLEMETMLE